MTASDEEAAQEAVSAEAAPVEDLNMEEVLGKGVRKVEAPIAEPDVEVESR